MAFTQLDLDGINRSIATGELTVEVNGRRVTYRDMSDLERAKKIIEADLKAQAGSTTTGGQRRGAYRVNFSTGRGF